MKSEQKNKLILLAAREYGCGAPELGTDVSYVHYKTIDSPETLLDCLKSWGFCNETATFPAMKEIAKAARKMTNAKPNRVKKDWVLGYATDAEITKAKAASPGAGEGLDHCQLCREDAKIVMQTMAIELAQKARQRQAA